MRYQSLLFVSLISVAALGCAVEAGPAGPNDSSLIEVPLGTEPLEVLDSGDWSDAQLSCDERLGERALRFHLVSASDGLIAVIDSAGHVVCVDSLESVQDELEEQGRQADADELGHAFLVTIGLAYAPDYEGFAMRDPWPQPNVDASGGTRRGDPSPQPNTQPCQK